MLDVRAVDVILGGTPVLHDVNLSVATGELAARWDTKAGKIHGLPAATLLGTRAALREDVAGHHLRVSIGSFFQSGPQGAELLIDTVRRAAPELAGAHDSDGHFPGVTASRDPARTAPSPSAPRGIS